MKHRENSSTYCTQANARKLSPSARHVFNGVLAAIQDAEELGGPEGFAYLELMQAIIDEANFRMCSYREILADQVSLN